MYKFFILICLTFSMHLQAQTKVLAFAGSLRSESVNKKLIKEAAHIASNLGADVKVLDLKNYPMPIYDADLEAEEGMPENVKFIRDSMIESHLILIASPDYNGSVSALLKNVIDWSSRSEEKKGSRDAFKGKKFVIMSASPGKAGGAKGLIHLRTILENMGGQVNPKTISIPDAYNAFDETGKLKDHKLQSQLYQLIKNSVNSNI